MDNQSNLVWYACYGSNILYARFLCYIQGGTFYANAKEYRGCTDKTPPRSTKAIIIPYEMYFGNESGSWLVNGKKAGVAFLDLEKRATTLGRMYLVTEEQFHEIWEQEGKKENWYDKIIDLGECDNYPIKTFTSSKRRIPNAPSDKYLEVICKGYEEIFPDLVSLFA